MFAHKRLASRVADIASGDVRRELARERQVERVMGIAQLRAVRESLAWNRSAAFKELADRHLGVAQLGDGE
jgi:hypothetical protein